MRDKWVECPGDVGRLRIHKIPGKLPAVTFSSAEQILKDNKVAREHKFKLHSIKEMTLGVFSCTVRKLNFVCVEKQVFTYFTIR
ncbi:hypothetical protein E2C01_060261 [Portunus trituberculatus]|uniref:Uncharacterized protein n=1 Tax=Portunus trituberculatus TaxID=210409 RepID=A0A5B7H9Z7_PORTR|nr:hypothetical protein [Portunus trituberculatus]